MIESILHLFKIHGKMIFGNSPIIVQDMLRKTPKALNAVNVILGVFVHQCFAMVQGMMLAQSFQRVVAPKRVRVIDRALSGFLPDDGHKLLFGHMFHHTRVHLAIALQKAKNNVFSCRASSALALASAAEIAFIHLHLAVQFTAFQLGHMIDRFTEALIDACDCLIVKAKIMREAVCRLLLVEAPDNSDLGANLPQGLLLSTGLVSAPHISSGGLTYFERTTKNALLTPQKVGRAPKNILFSSNHKGILAPHGYETH